MYLDKKIGFLSKLEGANVLLKDLLPYIWAYRHKEWPFKHLQKPISCVKTIKVKLEIKWPCWACTFENPNFLGKSIKSCHSKNFFSLFLNFQEFLSTFLIRQEFLGKTRNSPNKRLRGFVANIFRFSTSLLPIRSPIIRYLLVSTCLFYNWDFLAIF